MGKVSKLSENRSDAGLSISGRGMDRIVEKKTPMGRKIGYGAIGLLILAFAGWLIDNLLGGRSLSVNAQRVAVSNVTVGTYEDFENLIRELRDNAMFWLQDIVPNHMAFDSQNRMLMDVLENMDNSEFFHFFDIDWDHFYESLNGKLLAPFLGKFYSESLEDGEIQLNYDKKGLGVTYYALRLPLRLDAYVKVFKYNIAI